jgi:hypothetical protein
MYFLWGVVNFEAYSNPPNALPSMQSSMQAITNVPSLPPFIQAPQRNRLDPIGMIKELKIGDEQHPTHPSQLKAVISLICL